MTLSHPDGNPSITQLPDQEDLVAVSPTTGAAYVPVDEEAQEDRDFVQPPGRGKAVFALGTSQAIDNSEGGISKTFFPQIMVAFGVGNAGLGLINALSMYARMIFGPVWAMAADRFGRKKILFIVTGLWGLWTVATGFAQTWNQLLVLYGISLVGTVASEPIVNGLLGSLYRKSERGKAFGAIRGTSSLLGMALTPAIGQLGDNPNGWRYAMMVMGVLSIVSGLLILAFVKEPEKAERISDDPDAGMFKLSDAAKLFKIPTITATAFMLPLITSMVLFGFMGKYWAVELGYGVKNAAYLYTIFQAGSMLSAFLGGFLADFFVRKMGHKGRVALFQLYALTFAAMTFLAFQVSWGRGIYYVVVFLLGLIFSIGFSGCVLPMVSSVCPKQLSATSFAVLFSLIQGFLTATISIFVGHIADDIGLQKTLFWFVTIPYALNAVYWFIFYRIYPRDVARQAERTRLIEQGKF
ncbi:MFS transporter [Luteococcus peritonei]|uniref:MFS transporter n=1 Tax=Luteococcus peritonei TaxID=88874 RepID=A0ABW4S0D0_9ACTN